MQEKPSTREERRPYEPPSCTPIDLVPDEVLAIGCKTGGGTGQLGSCHIGLNTCPTMGS